MRCAFKHEAYKEPINVQCLSYILQVLIWSHVLLWLHCLELIINILCFSLLKFSRLKRKGLCNAFANEYMNSFWCQLGIWCWQIHAHCRCGWESVKWIFLTLYSELTPAILQIRYCYALINFLLQFKYDINWWI